MHTDLQNAIASLTNQIASLGNVATAYDHCAAMQAKFNDYKISLFPDSYTEGGQVLVSVYDCKDLETIVPLIRFLRQKGHKVTLPYKDSADPGKRTYYLEQIQLEVFLSKSEDAVSGYVQVGVKEVPVYELRCESAEVAQ